MSTLMGVISDLESAKVVDEMSAKAFMLIARIIEAREGQFKRDLLGAIKSSLTDDEWKKLTSKLAMVVY